MTTFLTMFPPARVWPRAVLVLSMVVLALRPAAGQVDVVTVHADDAGTKLQVNGNDIMVLGMNWDYFPIGTTYTYSLWTQSDDVVRAALDGEMPLLRAMGVNAIRVYTGIPPRWVRYIYERYGIYTVLNHSFGRYGVTVDGLYNASTDYSDERTIEVLVGEVAAMVEEFRDTPGVLMWMLGNENNYGLVWTSAETEALPEGERDAARARYLYKAFERGVRAIKERDTRRPVALVNGDLQYLDIIAEEVKSVDIFGTNVYRGISANDAFQRVKQTLGKPFLFTEFGADAFNAKDLREDQETQARYLLGQWQEIYEQSYGKGRVGNAIGGLTFQFSDGWWKYMQDSNLDVHDINASWPNAAYPEDYVEGENNMNEEWWGICAKGPTNSRGTYDLYPRAAYYVLREAYTLDPYGPGTTLATIRSHFGRIQPMEGVLQARGDKAALASETAGLVRVSGLRIQLETINTGGERVSTPEDPVAGSTARPSFRGFDHLESVYADITAQPSPNVRGMLSLNVLGHVPQNPIDEIFYENRGQVRTVRTTDGDVVVRDIERVKIYRASIDWEAGMFAVNGFYRTGHYHWGYEGDFFGLYREANYGPNIDIYNGEAPLGVEVTGKRFLDGLTLAFGPELWWGANPAVLVKYRRDLGLFEATAIYQEDLARQNTAVSSFAIPLPPTRKATLHLATSAGPLNLELGGIWSGSTKVGNLFQIVTGTSGTYTVLQDRIKDSDTFGGKVKLTFQSGRWNWYAQGALMGLVADGGPTSTLTFAGWRLKDEGTGNQMNVLTGLALNLGPLQIAPNVKWQKPIEGPIPGDVQAPGRPRNILADPFAVRANREMLAGELLLTYDPTPATWMYAWDSDVREDAPLAASIGFVYRHQPTTQDAAIGILADGRTTFAFPGAPPARDLWESYARIVSKLGPRLGFIANIYAGQGEPNGNDTRLIERYGGDIRIAIGTNRIAGMVKVNDWGPYDYHRDFNLTYPLQISADLSTTLGTPLWFDLPQTRFGIRASWRSLDRYSPRYCPTSVTDALGNIVCDPTAPGFDEGAEWEIRTYLHLNVGS